MANNMGPWCFQMLDVLIREIGNGHTTTSQIRKAASAYIPELADPYSEAAKGLDRAVASAKTRLHHLIVRTNPDRPKSPGVWALTTAGKRRLAELAPAATLAAPRAVAVASAVSAASFAEQHARAIAAEERADQAEERAVAAEERAVAAEGRAKGLAERLAESESACKRHVHQLRECEDALQVVREIRGRMERKAQRLEKRLAMIRGLILELKIHDPSVPF